MPTPIDTSLFGKPVEVSQISRELKKLWEEDAGATTRASLINFVVYFRGTDSVRENIELVSEFTRQHACRALLLCHVPDAPEPKVSAWINAHCHLTKAGAKQICCEQISFLFEGDVASRISNTLLANLDSDLPLYLWWQGEFPDPIDETLWPWVNRLIYDSQQWSDPRRQFKLLLDSIERAQTRATLCDLNWARSLHLRQALAQMFDHPENLEVLDRLSSVRIAHAPENRSTAILFASWLAAQLELTSPARRPDGISFRHPEGQTVEFALEVATGRSISLCELSAGDANVTVQRDQQGDFFRVEVNLPTAATYRHLLPAGSNSTTSLLLWEIGGGSQHKVYRKAIAIADEVI
ncbi:MAG: glucose-6-phosphate dehydrogenase assembly protein OpcA [Chthoniobacteraceae bacterium]